MRCFVAVELPGEVKEELRKIQDKIREKSGSYGLKASFNKEHHITLKFLGELTPDKAERVKEKLGRCKAKKFTTSMDSIGVFPNENYIRVLWIGLDPEKGIIEMRKEVDEELQKGFPKEKNFKAHMTIARVKFVEDKKNFLQWLKKLQFERKKFRAEGFKLMRSTLTKEGPVYDELASYQG